MKKKFSSKYIILLIFIVVIATFFIFKNKTTENKDLSSELELKFAELNKAKTNFCAGPDILEKVNSDSLQGSCCSKMVFHRYEEQVNGLAELREEYSPILNGDLRLIVEDPYDIKRSLAEEFLNYQKTIQLTPEQQEIYNEAMKMSHEGGPCCCKCWRWYAFEGQAKYLIVNYNFNAEQIAELWDIQDGCGGAGHAGHEGDIDRETFEPEN